MKTIGITIISHDSYEDVLAFFSSFINYNSPLGIDFLILETSTNDRMKDLGDYIQSGVSFQVDFIPNNGYAYACNRGINYFGDHDIFVLSNADVVFTSEIVSEIRKNFNRTKYGTIIQKNPGGRVVTFDLYPQYKSLFTEVLKIHRLLNKFTWYNHKYVYIVGAFMIFGNEVIKQNGLFDEEFFLYCEETDYYYRLRNNDNAVIIKNRYVIHNISSSIGKKFNNSKSKLLESSLAYYYKKHEYKPFLDYWKVSRKVNSVYRLISSLFVKKDKEEVCI
ncbi:glycosyltransferase family 2 protein [Spirosoma radiotolerans]|uniref:Glycosyltransferase 2-like domain-containing protein n=1 Tax=Spirosoma radiotolerans TaxID=1379870 RepID=A0A0E3ZU15_9BACT|nr:glycosyltransferase family 2 protein [Spirosoma radiotolerans]AKD55339.1 hypothetical protein SD10_10955 [Spirosoma radiotolerans]